jgi:hypothetical protein
MELYDVRAGRYVGRLQIATDRNAIFGNDINTLFTAKRFHGISRWHLPDLNQEWHSNQHSALLIHGTPPSLTYVQAQELLFVSLENWTDLLDASTGKLIHKIEGFGHRLALTEDGTAFVACQPNGGAMKPGFSLVSTQNWQLQDFVEWEDFCELVTCASIGHTLCFSFLAAGSGGVSTPKTQKVAVLRVIGNRLLVVGSYPIDFVRAIHADRKGNTFLFFGKWTGESTNGKETLFEVSAADGTLLRSRLPPEPPVKGIVYTGLPVWDNRHAFNGREVISLDDFSIVHEALPEQVRDWPSEGR